MDRAEEHHRSIVPYCPRLPFLSLSLLHTCFSVRFNVHILDFSVPLLFGCQICMILHLVDSAAAMRAWILASLPPCRFPAHFLVDHFDFRSQHSLCRTTTTTGHYGTVRLRPQARWISQAQGGRPTVRLLFSIVASRTYLIELTMISTCFFHFSTARRRRSRPLRSVCVTSRQPVEGRLSLDQTVARMEPQEQEGERDHITANARMMEDEARVLL